MARGSMLLLKTLLVSTSGRNVCRYSKDEKKRRRIVGNAIGVACLYAMLMACCIAICIGYGSVGLIDAAPAMCALMICALSFAFTFLKTNGYLFNFKEYDLLMSLPFEVRTVAACKFLYMYVKSLPWYMSISVAMLIGYGRYAHPSALVYPAWIVLSLFLPVIPMLIAAFLGFLIAKIGAGFKKANVIQTVLTFIFIIFGLSARFIVEDLFRNDKVQAALATVSEVTEQAAAYYPPAGWFADAVARHSIADGLLLIGASVLLFAAVFHVVGASYRAINSALKSHAATKSYRMAGQKKRSAVAAIAFKELKRLTSSTVYMTNAAMGEVLAALAGVATLIIGFDTVVAAVTQGAPFDYSILQPAIPFIVYFFIGMIATTVCSPSLEGKNYWIIQSLPIEMKTVYQGKMLFNMALAVPFMAFSTMCLCISAKVSAADTILYLLLGFTLCAFSTAWGCVCGVRHMRLDWENEIEPVKQNAAIPIYMFPNMFATMGLTALVVFLGTRMDHRLLMTMLMLVAAALALLSYRRVMRLAKPWS